MQCRDTHSWQLSSLWGRKDCFKDNNGRKETQTKKKESKTTNTKKTNKHGRIMKVKTKNKKREKNAKQTNRRKTNKSQWI